MDTGDDQVPNTVMWSSFEGEPEGVFVTLLLFPSLSFFPCGPTSHLASLRTPELTASGAMWEQDPRKDTGKKLLSYFCQRMLGEGASPFCLKSVLFFLAASPFPMSFYSHGRRVAGILPNPDLALNPACISVRVWTAPS